MINNKYLINQTLQIYSSKQAKIAEKEFISEQKLLRNNEYSDVTYALKGVIFDLEKAIYNKDEELVKKLTARKLQLQTQKNEILKSFSLENNCVYECDVCKDSGYLQNGEYCNCFYKTLSKSAIEFVGAKQKALNSFAQNTIDKTDKNYILINKLKKYAENFSLNSNNLLLLGNPGTGKTFLASAIANEVDRKSFNALFFNACDFNQALLNYHLANNYEKSIYYDVFTSCDLLVIDDLGTEPIYKNVTIEYLTAIISERLSQNKPFIITTNLQPEKLDSRYGQRLYSRFNGKKVIKIEFIGKDLR